MTEYTTGEIAKLCNITVRTVQYYDTCGILNPSRLSAGGRRLYSDKDLQNLKIICFLRELGMPIDSISRLLNEEHPDSVISILIEQQEQVLKAGILENQLKLERLHDLKSGIKNYERFSVDIIGDIALLSQSKQQLKKTHKIMLLSGIIFDVVEWGTILFWMITQNWRPFALFLPAAIIYGVLILKYYHNQVAYICPECHEVFRPEMKDIFWAKHTPDTRELTCSGCGHHGVCVEIYGGKQK